MDFDACIKLIHPIFPPELVNERYTSRIVELAPRIESFSIASVECRLTKEDDGVDLAIGFEADTPTDWLEKLFLNPTFRKGEDVEKDQRLDNLLQFFNAPSPPQQHLKESIRGFWLNFDFSVESGIPMPWVYLVFRKIKLGAGFYAALLTKSLLSLDLIYDQFTLDRMEEAVNKLPDHADLLGVAIPTHSDERTFRLVIYGMNFGEILTYLENIGWPGNLTDLDTRLSAGGALCYHLGLLLDFSNGELLSKIGIEMLVREEDSILHVAQLIQFMLGLGVCDPVKANAINQWIQYVTPPEVSSQGHTTHQQVNRWVNHFKLVYDSKQSIQAKCYFGLAAGK